MRYYYIWLLDVLHLNREGECRTLGVSSLSHTTMTAGPQPHGHLASEQYPGHNLSIIEALNVVSMKLSQADDVRYVCAVACFSSIHLKTNALSSRSLTLPMVRTLELQALHLSHTSSRSNLSNKQCLKH